MHYSSNLSLFQLQYLVMKWKGSFIRGEATPLPLGSQELKFTVYIKVTASATRMPSSRMRTIHCSGRRGGLSAQGGVCPEEVSDQWGCMLGHLSPPMNRILDTHLWKHYLSSTMFWTITKIKEKNRFRCNIVNSYVVPQQLFRFHRHRPQFKIIEFSLNCVT